MADAVDPIAKKFPVWYPEAIEFGGGSYAEIPVIHIIEATDGIRDLLLINLIPRLVLLAERGAVSEVK